MTSPRGFAPSVVLLGHFLLVSTCASVSAGPLTQGLQNLHASSLIDKDQPHSMQAKKLVIIDTDAGGDDAVAILAILAAEARGEDVRVLAVTCVNGNTDVDNVTRNVFATLSATNRLDIPVFRGAERPLIWNPPTDGFFGADGFGDFLPRDNGSYGEVQVQKEPAALALMRLVREHPGAITLMALAPLTNVALAARLDSSLLGNLADVYFLGGSARGGGNIKGGTEFNVYIDPEAAQIVLDSVPKPLFVLPIEPVRSTDISKSWRQSVLGALPSKQMDLLNKAERTSLAKSKGDRWPAADILLCCALLRPALLPERTVSRMDVVLDGSFARGATIVDYNNRMDKARNIEILEGPDVEGVKSLLLQLFGNSGTTQSE